MERVELASCSLVDGKENADLLRSASSLECELAQVHIVAVHVPDSHSNPSTQVAPIAFLSTQALPLQ